jgi:hypothetical protein
MAKMSQYENYKTEGGTPYSAEEQATFESTGVVPVSGKYHDGDTDMVTKTIGLDEIISSGFPAHTQSDAGTVLGVDEHGELEWVEKFPAYGGDSDKGKVLTITGSHGDTVEWVTPGGGGGDSNVVYLDLTTQYINEQDHLTAASLTTQELVSNVESGKTVIARRIRRDDETNIVTQVTQIMLSYYAHYGNEHEIYFSPAGSGAPNMGSYVIVSNMTEGNLWTWQSDMWEVSDLDETQG